MARTSRRSHLTRRPPSTRTETLRLGEGGRFVGRCFGKASYGTRKLAMREARKHNTVFRHKEKVYRCPICGMYHTTTHPRRAGGGKEG